MKFSLNRLTIVSFRGIQKSLVVDFEKLPAGLYFVRGRNEAEPRLEENGAGKSSVFSEAPSWAITGRTSRAQRPGSDVENWNAKKSFTSVKFEFSLDDDRHIIERTRNPGGLILDSKTVTQAEIDSLLPFTDSALRRSILIDQFGQMFLDLGPEEKSRIFSETLNLDLWLDAAEKAGSQLTELDREQQRLDKTISGIKDSLSELRVQEGELIKAEVGFEKEMEAKLVEARERRREARTTSKEAEAALNTAREGWAAFPGLDKSERELNSLKIDKVKLEKEGRDLNTKLATTKAQIQTLKKRLESYSDTKVCPECGQKVSAKHINEKRLAVQDEHEELRESLADLEKGGLTILNLYEQTTKRIEELEKELIEYHKHQSLISLVAQHAITATRELNRINEEIEQLETAKNPYTDQIKRLQRRIKELRDENRQATEKLDKVNSESEIYKFWQRGFREIRLEQIDATLLELEMAANHHSESLGLTGWEIGFATEREKKTGGISHKFSVFLYPPGEKEPVSWESYSGGESQRWQLAVTFGLAEVLLARAGISTDFEVLDEPTHHLSGAGIDDLLECLKNRAVELNRRIFLIDHHSLDRGAFDGVITVVRDKKRGVYIEEGGPLPMVEQKRERVRL